jgi:putative transposase
VKIMTLDVDEFIRRFLLHVVPRGFMRIRHFGLLANRTRRRALVQCRKVLRQPPLEPEPSESVIQLVQRLAGVDLSRCPVCGEGRMAADGFPHAGHSHAGYVMKAPRPSSTGHGGHRPDQSWCAVVPAVAAQGTENRSYHDQPADDAGRVAPRDSRDLNRRSPAMVLIHGAQEVTYYDNYDPDGKPELEQISYILDVSFPAVAVVCYVSKHLAEEGWRPLQRVRDDGGNAFVIHARLASHHQPERLPRRASCRSLECRVGKRSGRYPVVRAHLSLPFARASEQNTTSRCRYSPTCFYDEPSGSRQDSGGDLPAGELPHIAPDEVAQCRAGTGR